MNTVSILNGFIRDSFKEAIERFGKYQFIYLGLLIINILIRLPSSHLGYDSSNIFYLTSVSIILQMGISALIANLIITKIAFEKNEPKANLFYASLKSIKGQIIYFLVIIFGFLILLIPAFLALYFFCLTPILEVLEEHKGVSSLKRSQYLVKKDMLLVFELSVIIFVLYIAIEFIFSRLSNSGLGIALYLISAAVSTFVLIIVTLTYIRLIDYLKRLRVVGIVNKLDLP